jgi:hypothetical protein
MITALPTFRALRDAQHGEHALAGRAAIMVGHVDQSGDTTNQRISTSAKSGTRPTITRVARRRGNS